MNSPAVQSLLQFVNKLPLDKEGKLEFIKNHIKTLKQFDKEIEENKEMFTQVLSELTDVAQIVYPPAAGQQV